MITKLESDLNYLLAPFELDKKVINPWDLILAPENYFI